MGGSIGKGYSTEYLTREVGQSRENYYTGAVAEGEPPGRWWGAGAAALSLAGEVDADEMAALYYDAKPGQARAAYLESAAAGYPLSGAELARRFGEGNPKWGQRRIAEAKAGESSRPLAFFDLTYAPPKSVTVAHTAFARMEADARKVGNLADAERWSAKRVAVEEAVLAGSNAMLEHYQSVASYARVGRHTATSGRWIDGAGLVGAQFFQHTSRSNDPHLHVHAAILNKIRCADGKTRALDGQLLYGARPGASAVGDRVMMEHLSRGAVGAAWELREDGFCFELVGVPQSAADLFSKRAGVTSARTAEKVARFVETFGNEPSALQLARLTKEASRETRAWKTHNGETRDQALERWDRELWAEVTIGLETVAAAVGRGGRPVADTWSPTDVITRALDAVQADRSTFTRSDLERAVLMKLPPHLGTVTDRSVTDVVRSLTDAALARTDLVTELAPRDVQLAPPALTLANGGSVFVKPGAALYATTGHLRTEHTLREAAVERGRESVSVADANRWITANTDGRGWGLGVDQAAAVRGMLTDGAAMTVLVGPAGAGKSRTLGAYAEAWSDLTGGRVFGLATSQRATEVLADDGVTAMNCARWLATQGRLSGGGAARLGDEPWRLDRRDVVVIDEGAMVTTAVVDAVREATGRAGAKMGFTGDPAQLNAPGAGGAMGMVTDRAATYRLTEVRRFAAGWEAAASLRLRERDPAVLATYDRHGRVLGAGTAAQAGQQAARAYLGDVLAGQASVVVAATNDQAAAVAAQIREHLAELGRVGQAAVILGRDGNECGVGDLVQGRRNDRSLGVMNRGRYVVGEVHPDGSMTVSGESDGRTLLLPSGYVERDVTLGYASTAHSAQGLTVDTSHAVVSSNMDPAALYVALSRGRESNTAHVATRQEVADAPTGETARNELRAPVEVLESVLGAERETDRAALVQQEDSAARAASAAVILARQEDSMRVYGELRTELWLDRLAAEGVLSERDRRAFTVDQGTGQLSRLLRAVEQAGHDPERALREAVAGRTLDDARSVAQVVHHRIVGDVDLAPQLERGSTIPGDAPDEWREHFERLADRADDRRRELGADVAAEPPRWALDALGPVPDDVVARAEWEHRAGVVAAHREATGHTDDGRPIGPSTDLLSPERRASWFEAWAALGRPDTTREEQALTEGALRNRVAAWERERAAIMPDELFAKQRATERAIAKQEQDVAILRARADVASDREQAAQLYQQADDRASVVEVMRDMAADLEQVEQVKAQQLVDTAVTRENAMKAERELAARGAEPVGDESDRTTAEEWLAAEREARAQDDPHRQVHETDVVEPERETVDVWGRTTDDVDDAAEADREDGWDWRETDAVGVAAADQEERQPETADAATEPEPVMPAGVPTAAEVDVAVAVARVRAAQLADRASVERASVADNAEAEQSTREQAWRAQDAADAQTAAEASDDAEYAY